MIVAPSHSFMPAVHSISLHHPRLLHHLSHLFVPAVHPILLHQPSDVTAIMLHHLYYRGPSRFAAPFIILYHKYTVVGGGSLGNNHILTEITLYI